MCYIVEQTDGNRIKYLTTQEAADILGLKTRAWMHRLVKDGHITPAAELRLHPKVKNFLLFRPSDVQALKALREEYPPVNGSKWRYPEDVYKRLKAFAAANPEALSPEIREHLAYGQVVARNQILTPSAEAA